MIHHSVENFVVYKFCTKLFPRKCLTRPQNRLNYLETQKKTKKIAFPPSYFGRCSLNFRARLMYDTSFCQEFYTLQLLYEAFSTKMLNPASESSQLLKNAKNLEKDAFPLSCFGRCSLNFKARLMYDASFCSEFYALQLLYETFYTKVWSTQDLKKFLKGVTRGQRPRAKCLPSVLRSKVSKQVAKFHSGSRKCWNIFRFIPHGWRLLWD